MVSIKAWRHSASASGSLTKGDGGTTNAPPVEGPADAGADPLGEVTIDRSKRVLATAVPLTMTEGAPDAGVEDGADPEWVEVGLMRLDFSDRMRSLRSNSDRL